MSSFAHNILHLYHRHRRRRHRWVHAVRGRLNRKSPLNLPSRLIDFQVSFSKRPTAEFDAQLQSCEVYRGAPLFAQD